jgi:hypothetical protein
MAVAKHTLLYCQSPAGLPCPAEAKWRVRVGTREIDAQRACGRHLHRVCQALYKAEAPRKPVLTVEALPTVNVP